ncbi:unnamed protein product, partial [Symbiodinium pilosum]
AYSIVIKAFAQEGRLKEATAWLQTLASPDIEAFNTVLHGYARVGQVEEAEAWMARAQFVGLSPTAVSYTSLVDACAKSGRLGAALHFVRQAAKSGVATAFLYHAAIDAYAKQGCLADAEKLFDEMEAQRLEPGREAFTGLVHAAARSGQPAEVAESWLRRAEAAGRVDVMLVQPASISIVQSVASVRIKVHLIVEILASVRS